MNRKLLLIPLLVAACGGGSTNISENRNLLFSPGIAQEFDYNENPPYGANPPPLYEGWTIGARGTYPVKPYVHGDGVVATVIDTRAFPYQTFNASGPNVAYENRLGRNGVSVGDGVAWDVSIEVVKFDGTGVGQLTFVSYITDGKSTFAWVINLWDNRLEEFPAIVMQDREVAFVTEGAGSGKYHNAVPVRGSSSPYGKVEYKIELTNAHLQKAVNDLNSYCTTSLICKSFSNDMNSYKIISYGVLHEVFLLGDKNRFVNMQTKFGNINMYRITK